MHCQPCNRPCHKHGFNRNQTRRYRCPECLTTYSEERQHLFGTMRIDEDKALMALHLLCEGSSVRSVSRVTGLHKNTLLSLLVTAGEACERFMAETIQDVPVEDVEFDEIWGYVYCKERTKHKIKAADPELGDAYCFVGFERHSKLVVAWHLGRRTALHCDSFMEKVDKATAGHFQATSDAFAAYPDAVNFHLGTRTDFATMEKIFGYEAEEQRRYSPPRLIGTEVTPRHGNPDPDRIGTSYVERMNLSIRMHVRRLTRLTNAFSKCWRNHKAALALFFAWYNFVKMHGSVRMTPAMAANVARRPWSMRDLMEAAARS